MRGAWVKACTAVLFLLPLLAQAQITFRAAATATTQIPQYRSSASAVGMANPQYRASNSAATAGATLTINRPAGVVANDMLIASVGVQPSTAVLTPPAGWVLIRRTNNAGPTSNSLAVYRKLATGAEPVSYAWTIAGGSYTVGGIQAYYNIDTASPIDVEAGQTTPSATTHATPSVTTTVARAMVVTSHTFASSRTWTQPPGMTLSFQRRSAGAQGPAGQAVLGSRVLQAAVGATGAKTATAAADADAGVTHILALRPLATAQILTITRPAGAAANDVLVASIGFTPSSATIAPPAGWTLVRRIDNAGPTANSLAVYRKTVAAGEPANYTWTLTGVNYIVGGIQDFYGVSTTTPIDAEAGQATPSDRDHATPTITTTVGNTMLVGSYTYASSQSWDPRTPPNPAMTESYEQLSGAAGSTGQSIEGTRLPQAAAGAVPAYTSRAGNPPNADAGATHILALRPATPNLTITRPASVVANDVMIVSVGVTPSTATITPPAGWTSIRRINNAGPTSNSLEVFYRVASAGEPASYTWSLSGSDYGVAGFQAFFNVDTTSPINAEAGQATPVGRDHAAPAITPTVANAMLVGSYTYASSQNWTPLNPPGPPPAMTESFDQRSGAAGAVGQSIEGTRLAWATAGLTPAFTSRAAGTAPNYDAGATHMLALRPMPNIPGNFNACEVSSPRCDPAVANYDRIRTKIAGAAFSLDLVALRSDGTLETGFNNNVTMSLVASVGLVPLADLDATTRCPPAASVTNIPVGTVTFASGRATPATGVSVPAVAEAYKDVRVRIVCDAATCPAAGLTRCSADNFAIRPNSLTLAVTDDDWQTAGTTRTLNNITAPGGTVHKAGQPFTLSASARNAAATPAVTANYVGTAAANIVSHILPNPCRNGGGCTLTPGTFTASSGAIVSNSVSYNEVGAFNLQLVDDTFAEVDNADSTPAEREIRSPVLGVGRFVPDHFALLGGSLVTPTCTASGSRLTYMGQSFGQVTATVAAQNAANATTWNYHSTAYAPGTVTWVAENNDAGTNLGSRLSGLGSTWTDGLYAVSSLTAAFSRDAAPDGPYDQLQLGVSVSDADGVALSGLDMNATTTLACAPCTAKAVGLTGSVRFGRLRLTNAYGSELRSLPMPVRAEHWNGTGFALNSADNCSTIGAVTLNAAPSTCTLTPAVSGAGNTLSSGSGLLTLSAPGVRGCTDVTVTAPDWLKSRWSGATYTENPKAKASFGVFKEKVLFRRENY